jgi:hypothetical protein
MKDGIISNKPTKSEIPINILCGQVGYIECAPGRYSRDLSNQYLYAQHVVEHGQATHK